MDQTHRPQRPFHLLLTIDLEEQRRLEQAGFMTEAQGLAREGALRLLELMERLKVPTTWFTTASFALGEPHLIRRLLGQGHEVALHGLHDRDDYKSLLPDKARARLSKAKEIVDRLAGTPTIGFRAPRFQVPDRTLLSELGLGYDSSLHPSPMPGRYSGKGKLKPYHDEPSGLPVVPVSVVPGARLPLGWLWFRAFPVSYTRWGSALVEAHHDYLCLYFHPWDFVDLRPYKDWLPPGFCLGSAGALDKLERFLEWGLNRGWQPLTVKDYLVQAGLLEH